MNNEFIAVIAAIIIMATIIGFSWLIKLRRAFLVPEGYAGLLYHKGKFVEVLRAGQHIRWGCKFTLGVNDLRKTSLLVAGHPNWPAFGFAVSNGRLAADAVTGAEFFSEKTSTCSAETERRAISPQFVCRRAFVCRTKSAASPT